MNIIYLSVSVVLIILQIPYYFRKQKIRKYIPNKLEWLLILSITSWMSKEKIFCNMKNHTQKNLPREVLDDLDDLLDEGYIEVKKDEHSDEILFRLLPKGRMVHK